MQLDCIRHGITQSNLEDRFNGISEEGLTAEQHSALASIRVETTSYDMVYCSPLNRCIETARGLKLSSWIVESRIVERNLGVFEGLTRIECQERFPDEFARFKTFDGTYAPPGAESRTQHLERIFTWIQDIRHHKQVLAITHGGTIDFLYRLGTDHPVHGGPEIFSGCNVCISRFEITGQTVRLLSYSEPISD